MSLQGDAAQFRLEAVRLARQGGIRDHPVVQDSGDSFATAAQMKLSVRLRALADQAWRGAEVRRAAGVGAALSEAGPAQEGARHAKNALANLVMEPT